jgi:hypothetical protein
VAQAQECRVLDRELAGRYSGPCKSGLAEGYGTAIGSARYEGEFKAGAKHGLGVKIWPSGDRYEGDFDGDQKHGFGTYTWGAGPWAGERYIGDYSRDRRHGHGVYRWPSGDVYSGAWDNDAVAGEPTEMMLARAAFEKEARKAVAKEGTKVCREMPLAGGGRDWVRGVVVGMNEEQVAVRIDDPGKQKHVVSGVAIAKGQAIWDAPMNWTPCW